METKDKECCGHDCCHNHNHHSPVWRLIKAFTAVIVILFVLLIGVAVGRKSSEWSGNMSVSMYKNGGMTATSMGVPPANMLYLQGNLGRMATSTATPVMGYQKIDPNATEVAGVIDSVSGTEITLTDNGGSQQMIYTSGSTIITAASGEIPVSALKTKEFIVAMVTAADGKSTAETIQVQP